MTIRRYVLTISLFTLLFSCGERVGKGDEATIQEKQQTAEAQGTQYIVDTSASRVRFMGYGVGKTHPGLFRLSSGM